MAVSGKTSMISPPSSVSNGPEPSQLPPYPPPLRSGQVLQPLSVFTGMQWSPIRPELIFTISTVLSWPATVSLGKCSVFLVSTFSVFLFLNSVQNCFICFSFVLSCVLIICAYVWFITMILPSFIFISCKYEIFHLCDLFVIFILKTF